MTDSVYVRTGPAEMDTFEALLYVNGYTYVSSSTGVTRPLIFQIDTVRKNFVRLHNTMEKCITVDDFEDLFL